MANGWNLDEFKGWDQLLLRASFERSPNDLLYIKKFGRSAALTANTAEDVWEQGGIRTIFTAAETLDIVSSSIADDFASTGAQLVQISGLDANYDLQSEVIVMDGTNAVTSVNSYIDVSRMRVVTAGSGQVNAGNITATGSTTAAVHAKIPIGESITQQSHFTVPNGYTLFTIDFFATTYRSSGSGTRNVTIDQMVYIPSINTKYRTLRYGVSSEGPFINSPSLISQTPAKTTLWYETTAEQNATYVTTSASYVLVKGDFNYRTEL